MKYYLFIGIIIGILITIILYYFLQSKTCPSNCNLGYYCDKTTNYRCIFKECPVDTTLKDNECICDFGKNIDGKCKTANQWLSEQFKTLNEEMNKILNEPCK